MDLPPWLQLLLRLLEIATQVAIVATFLIYWRQLRTMRGQLEQSRNANTSQNILAIISFIQQEHIHKARGDLIAHHGGRWSKQQRQAADIACGAYDIVAIMCRNRIVPTQILVDNWGNSIIKCREAATTLIAEYRRLENRGPAFWDDLEWLYHQCKISPLWDKNAAQPLVAADAGRGQFG